jgi:hypothetical protein
LRASNIDPKRRGETLDIDEFIRLAGAITDRALLTTGC